MIKLEKLSVHPKKKGYYQLEFSGEWKQETIDVHEDVLVKYSLRKGLEFSEEEYKQFKKAQGAHSVYLLAINYLSYRVRTEKEMRDYLKKKDAEASVIDETIDRLKEEKLLDDRVFSEMFVRSRKRHSNKGPRFILQELMQKGVAEKDARPALKQYSFSEQFDNALKFAESKMKASTALSYKERQNKIGQGLIQKGFDQEVVRSVLNELPEDQKASEWEALNKQANKALHRLRNLDESEKRYKLKQSLYRKGFSMDLINEYIEQLRDLED